VAADGSVEDCVVGLAGSAKLLLCDGCCCFVCDCGCFGAATGLAGSAVTVFGCFDGAAKPATIFAAVSVTGAGVALDELGALADADAGGICFDFMSSSCFFFKTFNAKSACTSFFLFSFELGF